MMMMLQEPGVSFETDPAAFFRTFYPQIYGFVSSSTGAARSDVEDLVQETLLQAWRDRARSGREASALTWILAIARHRIADFFRRRRVSEKADGMLRALARLDAERIPEDVLTDVELGRRVRRALQSISTEHARILVRRYLDGKKIREIAQEAGESEAAVESRLRRAQEALRKQLNSEEKDHD